MILIYKWYTKCAEHKTIITIRKVNEKNKLLFTGYLCTVTKTVTQKD